MTDIKREAAVSAGADPEPRREVRVELWYPRNDAAESGDTVRVSLMDVRVANDLVIRYDFDRDGYSIQQPTIHEWHDGDDSNDEELVEVAFVEAWQAEARAQGGPSVIDVDFLRLALNRAIPHGGLFTRGMAADVAAEYERLAGEQVSDQLADHPGNALLPQHPGNNLAGSEVGYHAIDPEVYNAEVDKVAMAVRMCLAIHPEPYPGIACAKKVGHVHSDEPMERYHSWHWITRTEAGKVRALVPREQLERLLINPTPVYVALDGTYGFDPEGVTDLRFLERGKGGYFLEEDEEPFDVGR